MEYGYELICKGYRRQLGLSHRSHHNGVHHIYARGDKSLKGYRNGYFCHRFIKSFIFKHKFFKEITQSLFLQQDQCRQADRNIIAQIEFFLKHNCINLSLIGKAPSHKIKDRRINYPPALLYLFTYELKLTLFQRVCRLHHRDQG